MKGENKNKLPKTGLKVWGHRSHMSKGRVKRVFFGKGNYRENWEKYAKKYLRKEL